MEKRTLALVALIVSLGVADALIWRAALAPEEPKTTVAFLDVGQGDAIFIEAPNGNQVLIDGGPDGSVLRELAELMPFYDRTIDVVIATHPDLDHIGGLIDVLERFEVARIIESGAESDTATYRAFDAAAENERAERLLARRGQVIDLGGAFLVVLFPDRDVSGIEPNAASVITQLAYGEQRVLLSGDAPDAIERYLVSLDSGGLQSEILKLGHHGSKTSSGGVFLGAVSPEYAVISAGADNRYGHPHQDVLARLRELKIPFLETKNGTVVFDITKVAVRLK